jgi:hypothetical protein
MRSRHGAATIDPPLGLVLVVERPTRVDCLQLSTRGGNYACNKYGIRGLKGVRLKRGFAPTAKVSPPPAPAQNRHLRQPTRQPSLNHSSERQHSPTRRQRNLKRPIIGKGGREAQRLSLRLCWACWRFGLNAVAPIAFRFELSANLVPSALPSP